MKATIRIGDESNGNRLTRLAVVGWLRRARCRGARARRSTFLSALAAVGRPQSKAQKQRRLMKWQLTLLQLLFSGGTVSQLSIERNSSSRPPT